MTLQPQQCFKLSTGPVPNRRAHTNVAKLLDRNHSTSGITHRPIEIPQPALALVETMTAAALAEPARAVPYVPPPGFWQTVREACDAHGALLIFDEIPTGLGKTGRLFACAHDGVIPDILVLGKALGGGLLPISPVVCKPEPHFAGHFTLGPYTH